MNAIDPITGPLSREEFRSLWLAPFGAALEVIRKHDPLYGRKPGEKIRWLVTLKRDVPEIGTATVIAATEEEAIELADNLTEAQIDWEPDDNSYWDNEGTIEKVEPDRNFIPRGTPLRLIGMFERVEEMNIAMPERAALEPKPEPQRG